VKRINNVIGWQFWYVSTGDIGMYVKDTRQIFRGT
jgi:hypothetical protein